MEYSIDKLAQLAGVSTRTLRYYDQIGLLKPVGTSRAGCRLYGAEEVDLLQQILFYRALDLPLAEIARIVQADDFDRRQALESHLAALRARQTQTELLIETVQKTLLSLEGGAKMSDTEKFEAFKARVVRENEEAYGAETRAKYGDAAMEESNARMLGLSRADYGRFQALEAEIRHDLEQAVRAGERPTSDAGRSIVEKHREWLCYTWPQYSAEAHKGLTQGYVQDARFTAYYDRNIAGCAKFLQDAVLFFA